ncbi:MAG: VOC family protein [Bacteroides sp.]|nr:VOC family protein [Eubacterium sp.]MCM1417164.1 VOC family protein [Roseburia sp.]MCM1461215.1 VOC family protein [Bacteroides sp.]
MRIEHIALSVKDLEAAKSFFVKYFKAAPNGGYRNPITGFRSYFLTFDDGARLELTNRPETEALQDPFAEIGYSHIAFSVGSKEEVDRLTKVLKADGFEVIGGPRTTGDGYYESCIIGVEGNRIEITI